MREHLSHRSAQFSALTHQLCTICTDGVVSSLSGNKLISFMMFDNLTGSSCRRNTKDVFSQALMEPEVEGEELNLSMDRFLIC